MGGGFLREYEVNEEPLGGEGEYDYGDEAYYEYGDGEGGEYGVAYDYEGEEGVLHLPAPVSRLRFWSFPFSIGSGGPDGIVGPYKGLGGVHFGLWCKNGTLPAGPHSGISIDVSADGN